MLPSQNPTPQKAASEMRREQAENAVFQGKRKSRLLNRQND